MLTKQQTALADFIVQFASSSPHSHAEIALMCGFKTTAPIYGFMRGDMKVQLDKVAPLARALGCDFKDLLLLVLDTWFPENIVKPMRDACQASVVANSLQDIEPSSVFTSK